VKVRAYHVTFERVLEATIYAPEDATDDEVEAAAVAEIDNLDNWNMPDWEVAATSCGVATIPDDEARLTAPNRYGHRQAVAGAFSLVDSVLNDTRDGFAHPTDSDARWWVLGKDEKRAMVTIDGRPWLVSGAAMVREDVADMVADEWVGEIDEAAVLAVYANASTVLTPGNGWFDEKYRAVLSAGMVYGAGLQGHRVVRDGETIAIVMPMRDPAPVVLVDGKVQS
jgi:hypothetical protein